MNILSVQKLKKYLKEYSLHLEYWTPNDGDGNELLGCREILERHKDLLAKEDVYSLSVLDNKAKLLLDSYSGPETFDILMLKKAVDISISGLKQAA